MFSRSYLLSRGKSFVRRKGIRRFLFRIMEKLKYRYNSDFSQNYRLSPSELEEQSTRVFLYNPMISVVVPVYNTDYMFLKDMINSVLSQTYQNFELCIFNGGSTDEGLDFILKEYAELDCRIKYHNSSINGGISENTNKAIKFATGDYIGLLDHDDMLAPNALYEFVNVINLKSPDVIYSDEDKIVNGRHVETHKKPDWSPDTLLSYNYICHFLLFKKQLFDKVGGFESEFDGSQDYEFILRLCKEAEIIEHIPKVLYHWRISQTSTAASGHIKSYAYEAGKKAIEKQLDNKTIIEEVQFGEFFGSYRIIYKPTYTQKVTIVAIGTWKTYKDEELYYEKISASIGLSQYELVLLNNSNKENRLICYNCRVVGVLGEGYPSYMNKVFKQCTNDYVVVVSQNIDFLKENWCELLVSEAQDEKIGIVAPKILNNDNKIYSFGLALKSGEIVNTFEYFNKNYYGYFGRLQIAQNVTAVAPDFLLLRLSSLKEMNYLNEEYDSSISLIDFCINAHRKDIFTKIFPTELGKMYKKENLCWPEKEVKKLFELNESYTDNNRDNFFPVEIFH